MKCQKCGNKYHKKYLDDKGFCKDCSEDFSFKIQANMLSQKELDNIQKENKFWDTIEKNNHEFDFVPVFIGAMVFVAIYFFYKQPFEKAIFFNSLFSIVLIAVLTLIVYGISISIIKPIWLFFVKRINTLKGVRIFTVISFVIIAVISALIISISAML